jgi:hypothetical protein
MACCTEPGLTSPCVHCICIPRVTCEMGGGEQKKKNLTMDDYC